jgi:hypothetical protein
MVRDSARHGCLHSSGRMDADVAPLLADVTFECLQRYPTRSRKLSEFQRSHSGWSLRPVTSVDSIC